ncbi:helix-turn-helix transcriptional regulator [Methylocystis iwaonis]|uniref:helix-turn-helix domain-containing protein n=1 Tax=Methylocystis iwaonis TaxID=2885079 RepID=UPI002E7C0B33|nr:helix-turn-helix transcriptional regulator [Methylocystis iwaonis]
MVLPRAEYEALLVKKGELSEEEEEAADIAVFDQRMAELEENPEAALPREVNAALLRGATLVRALRDWRGVRQQELAAKAELGQGYLSDIERGRSQGSPEARESIARALDVPKEWLR